MRDDPDDEARERNRCPTCGHLAPITSMLSEHIRREHPEQEASNKGSTRSGNP